MKFTHWSASYDAEIKGQICFSNLGTKVFSCLHHSYRKVKAPCGFFFASRIYMFSIFATQALHLRNGHNFNGHKFLYAVPSS